MRSFRNVELLDLHVPDDKKAALVSVLVYWYLPYESGVINVNKGCH